MDKHSEKLWHIQMHLPEGKDGITIDPKDMLLRENPVIGTGEWDDPQCRNFKELPIGTIILVREGKHAIALCKIISESFTSHELQEKFLNINYRKVKILGFVPDEAQPSPTLFSQGTLKSCGPRTEQWEYIDKLISMMENNKTMESYIHLLKEKKNIILQGAPRTGKTYTTASIAVRMCNKDFSDFDNHAKVMKEYERLQDAGQIAFCTFHQSMDYEDFVEGLKPEIIGNSVEYNVTRVRFKQLYREPLYQ